MFRRVATEVFSRVSEVGLVARHGAEQRDDALPSDEEPTEDELMKDYMLLYKGVDPQWLTKSTPAEVQALTDKWGAWMDGLQKTEQLASGGSPLEYGGKALTNGGAVLTDIRSGELKERVTGYSIVRASNEEEAIAIAKTCPVMLHPEALVEVREVMKL
jgi:hypothetical protein